MRDICAKVLRVIILNEAFCKSACLRNTRLALSQRTEDIELNERLPSKKLASKKLGRGHPYSDPILKQPTKF
ncbi:unnamed protein product [Leptidea sinapis]|uniref:Uncharacterized protein n=1 Tax=Leptidea sinapis TaxID=189913 RepID=A0A5E4QZC5_9NEOP|nr:unnamed protein product [Leptidea sinapis]